MCSPGMCGRVGAPRSVQQFGPDGSREYNVRDRQEVKKYVRAWQVKYTDSLLFGVRESEKTKLDWPTWCECPGIGKPTCGRNFDVETCTPYGRKGKMLPIQYLYTML